MGKITKIINEFDPLDILPYAPQDEYEREINEIFLFINSEQVCDPNVLGNKIHEIFTRTLGSDIFVRTIDDCYVVAKKILG